MANPDPKDQPRAAGAFNDNDPSCAVIGPGPTGMFLAFSLAKTRKRVTLIGRPGNTSAAIKQQKHITFESTKSFREIDAMFEADGSYEPPDSRALGGITQDPDLTQIDEETGKRYIPAKALADKLSKLGAPIGQEIVGAITALQHLPNEDAKKTRYFQDDIEQLKQRYLRVPLYYEGYTDENGREIPETEFAQTIGSNGYVYFTDDPEKSGKHHVVLCTIKAQDKNRTAAEKTVLPVLREGGAFVDLANGMKSTIIPAAERNSSSFCKALTEAPSIRDANEFEEIIGRDNIVGASMYLAVGADRDNPARITMKTPMRDASIKVSHLPQFVRDAFDGSVVSVEGTRTPLLDTAEKVGVNLMNIISAIYDVRKDEVLNNPTFNALYTNMVGELYDTLAAYGEVPKDNIKRYEFIQECRQYHTDAIETAKHASNIHRSSTHNDVNRGRSTEVDFLLTSIVEIAKAHNAETASRKNQQVDVSHLETCGSFMESITKLIREGRLDEIARRKEWFKQNTHAIPKGGGEVEVVRLRPEKAEGYGKALVDIPYEEWNRMHPKFIRASVPCLMLTPPSKSPLRSNEKLEELLLKTGWEVPENWIPGDDPDPEQAPNPLIGGLQEIEQQWQRHEETVEALREHLMTATDNGQSRVDQIVKEVIEYASNTKTANLDDGILKGMLTTELPEHVEFRQLRPPPTSILGKNISRQRLEEVASNIIKVSSTVHARRKLHATFEASWSTNDGGENDGAPPSGVDDRRPAGHG